MHTVYTYVRVQVAIQKDFRGDVYSDRLFEIISRETTIWIYKF